MDLKGNNIDRASAIDDVFLTYFVVSRGSSDDDQEDNLLDLLSDLMHGAERENLNWLRCSAQAALHYDYESRNPEDS